MNAEFSTSGHQHVLWDLVRTAHVAERRFAEVFGEFGLSATQYGVMASLADGDNLSPAELARAILVRPQSLAGVVDTLVEAGLVVRDGPPGRGRRKLLSLSDRGRQVFSEARPAAYRLLRFETTGLESRQIGELGRILATLREHLREPEHRHERGDHEASPGEGSRT